jgi:murein DD-endopeptidase MepM/ murein hydrolase activator NlpD
MSFDALKVDNMMPVAPGGIEPADTRNMNREEAARQFEGYLAQIMVKEMRKTLPDDGLFSGKGVEVFSDVFDQEIAQRITDSGRLGLRESLMRQMGGDGAGALPRAPAPHRRLAGQIPVAGGVVSSKFGLRRDPFHGGKKDHKGVDISAERGAAIRPVKAGKVSFAGTRSGYGNLVIVDHGNGLQTRYAHCDRLLVRAGQVVEQGTSLATVGDTGRATGPHLHLEARLDGDAVDPVATFGWAP